MTIRLEKEYWVTGLIYSGSFIESRVCDLQTIEKVFQASSIVQETKRDDIIGIIDVEKAAELAVSSGLLRWKNNCSQDTCDLEVAERGMEWCAGLELRQPGTMQTLKEYASQIAEDDLSDPETSLEDLQNCLTNLNQMEQIEEVQVQLNEIKAKASSQYEHQDNAKEAAFAFGNRRKELFENMKKEAKEILQQAKSVLLSKRQEKLISFKKQLQSSLGNIADTLQISVEASQELQV